MIEHESDITRRQRSRARWGSEPGISAAWRSGGSRTAAASPLRHPDRGHGVVIARKPSGYDVVVAGGGSAGVAAAVGAAQAGARVLLVEAAGFLGGGATLRSLQTYCGLYTVSDQPRPVVDGVGGAVLGRLHGLGAAYGPVRSRSPFVLVDAEAVKVVLDALCDEAGVDVLLHARVVGAARVGNRVTSLTYVDHGGFHEVTASAFVDATGEADLASYAGASTRSGSHGLVNVGLLAMRIGGIDAEADLSAETWHTAIREAHRAGVHPLSNDQSLIARVPISGDVIAYLPSDTYDARSAASLSRAERLGRRQAWMYLNVIRTIKGCANAHLTETGPLFGARQSRHVNCRHRLTEQEFIGAARFDDSVALGSWATEFHDSITGFSDFTLPGGNGVYEIPLGALVSVDTPNLLAAGRNADGDQRAGASLRVMGTSFATGHASGVAAATFSQTGTLDPTTIRDALRHQNALIDGDDLPDPVRPDTPVDPHTEPLLPDTWIPAVR